MCKTVNSLKVKSRFFLLSLKGGSIVLEYVLRFEIFEISVIKAG